MNRFPLRFTRKKRTKKENKKYICFICSKERNEYDKTEIWDDGNWIEGCNECFLKSIDRYNKK